MLPPHEQAVMDRLESNPGAGWKPWKRDEQGQAVLRAEHRGTSGRLRVSTMTITKTGLVCSHWWEDDDAA